jgi:putative hemolysin
LFAVHCIQFGGLTLSIGQQLRGKEVARCQSHDVKMLREQKASPADNAPPTAHIFIILYEKRVSRKGM